MTVHDQRIAPNCPRNGSFQDWFQNPARSSFSQVCKDELMTLRCRTNPELAWSKRFVDHAGVKIRVLHDGSV
ncbi:hypothetical protein [uncultured Jatrophihabitans sp.]|uniref:hypothetical protein n=1 Tax=uncultured Jatrophihabitans sp. TaxID=1610747 RepID=UPI0035C9F884